MSKLPVLLRIVGSQTPEGEKPEAVELTTEGTLWQEEDHFCVRYEESALTGLEGVTTTFSVWPGRIVLSRTGAVQNQMEFVQGVVDQSLYDLGFGALLMEIRPIRVETAMSKIGGSFRMDYHLTIDRAASGKVSYEITVTPQSKK